MIDAYLERIGHTGPAKPSLRSLVDLHYAHLCAVPFENLDIGRGVPIRLEIESLVDKIVVRRRGGFCYELNGAFHWLLSSLGFDVHMLSARVRGKDGEWGIEFDHMLLAVDLDQRYIADVGFGDSYLQPLPLVDGEVVDDCHASYRLDLHAHVWTLSRRDQGEGNFVPQYRFTEDSHPLRNFKSGCDYHQSPASHFTRGDVCTRALPPPTAGRVTLKRDRLIQTHHGQRDETEIADHTAFLAALAQWFQIDLHSPR